MIQKIPDGLGFFLIRWENIMEWRGSEGTLAADFREKFEEIAKDLSQQGIDARTRFNPKGRGKCADIYSANDTLARVSVKGRHGGPCHFIIMCGHSFQRAWEIVFSRTLPGPVHFLSCPDL